MSVIQVNNISKHFGSLKAVDGLSFEVQAGQVFGFLGQNGSGKSTIFKLITGVSLDQRFERNGGMFCFCSYCVIPKGPKTQKTLTY